MAVSLKSGLAVSATAVMLMFNAAPVLGVETTSSTSASPKPRTVIQEQFKTAVQTLKGAGQVLKAKMHAARLQKNFAIYELRLNKIAARIQSLIDKRKAAGKDVTNVQAQLDAGKASLAKAVMDSKKAVDMFNAILLTQWDPKNAQVKAAISQAELARKEFVEARLQMVKSVKLLRELK